MAESSTTCCGVVKPWRIRTVKIEPDVKALTGRGTLSRLRQKLDGIDAILKQMRDLSEKSKSVPGLSFYLVVHQKSTTGYVFLRWRQRMGSNRHLSFEEVEELASGLPVNSVNGAWQRPNALWP